MAFRRSLYLIAFTFCMFNMLNVSAQLRLVPFESLDSLQMLEKRPVVVFIHTSWCRYCGAMKNSTFKKKEVVQLLNEKFYFVSFDAEDRQTIRFNGHQFVFKPRGVGTGVNELAEQLGTVDGMLGYPVLCFLNSSFEITYQHPGFLTAKELVKLLKQVASQG